MRIMAKELDFQALNERVRAAEADVCIHECCGQRFIGSGAKTHTITIHGTPGNALGAYLDGAAIEVYGNAQDAVGDTMNDGQIVIRGHAGDALGYAMRGGRIFVQGDAGYRTGIHMKEYEDKKPVIVIGGAAGSFLGEYQAGGTIVVLGLGVSVGQPPVGNFTGTGMHGGRIYIRTDNAPTGLPAQVMVEHATAEDLQDIAADIVAFAEFFEMDAEKLLADKFYVLKPNAKNPYKQLYTAN